MDRVFLECLDELEVELFDTGVLRREEPTNGPALSTFEPPNLETRLGSVTAVPQGPQSSSEPWQRTDVLDCLGKAPVRRTIHLRRILGPVNSTTDTTSGTSKSETTSTSREGRCPDRIRSRHIRSPWHVFKQDLMKFNLQTVKFEADAMRMLNGARLSVNGLYSIVGVVWLIASGINFSSTAALRFADLVELPSNNTMGPVNARPFQDVRMNHGIGNREERLGRFLTTRAPILQHVKMFAGINDHLHSRGSLSRLREPTTMEDAVWLAVKEVLESMCEIVDPLREGAFPKKKHQMPYMRCPRDMHISWMD